MSKTTLTLSDPVAQILKVYTVQSKSSLRAQSEVVEEALIEFFERHDVKIDDNSLQRTLSSKSREQV